MSPEEQTVIAAAEAWCDCPCVQHADKMRAAVQALHRSRQPKLEDVISAAHDEWRFRSGTETHKILAFHLAQAIRDAGLAKEGA